MVRVFDMVSMVLSEATKRFSPEFTMNKEAVEALERSCGGVDKLIEECGAVSMDAEVDDTKRTVLISVECHSISVDVEEYMYYMSAQNSMTVGVSASENSNIVLRFEFSGIWN